MTTDIHLIEQRRTAENLAMIGYGLLLGSSALGFIRLASERAMGDTPAP
jgi:hypothetical protein